MPPTKDYEIPRYGTPGDRLLAWCLEAVQEGESWLKVQQPAQGWRAAYAILSAIDGDDTPSPEGASSTGYNKTKRAAREIVASLAGFKHEGEFKNTWNQDLFDQAKMLTDLDRNWFRTTNAQLEHRKAIQYAVATGTAYLMETWDKSYWSPHRGDIRLQAIAPSNVLFVQLPSDHDLQRAYAVIIKEELPINLAKRIYGPTNPAFVASLSPDRQSPGWLSKGLEKVQQFVSPLLRVAGRMQPDQKGSFPTVDIFHMYTLDLSTNDGPYPIKMGAEGTNWHYIVPALNDPVPAMPPRVNPGTGNLLTRPATHEDCYMFPLRRYTIFSNTGICSDGTSPWWHGQVPLARLRFCDWAWEALGAPLVGETRKMQQGVETMMRGVEDAIASRLNPLMLFDDQLVSKAWANAINPRLAGQRASASLSLGKPIEFPIPPEQFNVPQYILEYIMQQEERMDYMMSTKDLVAIAKAKQIPGADTIEKLLEMAGPIVQDLIGGIATPLQQLGEFRKAYYFQFYTRSRMITVTGPEGVDLDVQYTPEKLIPVSPTATPEAYRAAAQRLLEEFQYTVTESGINEINRMTEKLFYLKLMELGYPISWWTFARIARIPNFGPPPQGTNTELERWIAQQHMTAELAGAAAEAAQPQPQLVGPDGQPVSSSPAGGANGQPQGQPPKPGAQQGPGRPNTFNKPPRLESKDGGSRTTISTS